jgi:hypothetical protein
MECTYGGGQRHHSRIISYTQTRTAKKPDDFDPTAASANADLIRGLDCCPDAEAEFSTGLAKYEMPNHMPAIVTMVQMPARRRLLSTLFSTAAQAALARVRSVIRAHLLTSAGRSTAVQQAADPLVHPQWRATPLAEGHW